MCQCDCGSVTFVNSCNLKNGNTSSCGCYRKQRMRELRLADRDRTYGTASPKKVFSVYRSHAKRKRREFSVTFEEFMEISQKSCHYCGKFPCSIGKTESNNGDFRYNGMDRIDSLKGYFLENIVTCCEMCNRAKLASTYAEFKEWVVRIHSHWIGRPDWVDYRD